MQSNRPAEKAILLEKLRAILNPDGNELAQQSIAIARRLNELNRGEASPEEIELLQNQLEQLSNEVNPFVSNELSALYNACNYLQNEKENILVHPFHTEISYPPFPDCLAYKDLRILPLLQRIVDQ